MDHRLKQQPKVDGKRLCHGPRRQGTALMLMGCGHAACAMPSLRNFMLHVGSKHFCDMKLFMS